MHLYKWNVTHIIFYTMVTISRNLNQPNNLPEVFSRVCPLLLVTSGKSSSQKPLFCWWTSPQNYLYYFRWMLQVTENTYSKCLHNKEFIIPCNKRSRGRQVLGIADKESWQHHQRSKFFSPLHSAIFRMLALPSGYLPTWLQDGCRDLGIIPRNDTFWGRKGGL